MAIRGSDGMRLETWNDWVENDAFFAIVHGHIPQAKLATVAMRERIEEIREKAPKGVTMDIAAHSLGTMVSIQGLAGLTSEELNSVGEVVLFDGPDTRKSIMKMGVSQDIIDQLDRKVTYYVNPFDIVSMLNRENTIYNLEEPSKRPTEKPLGNVHVVVPLRYTAFLNMDDSSHDFGVMPIGPDGEFMVASKDYHPELLIAGEKLARLEQRFLNVLRGKGYSEEEALNIAKTSVIKSRFAEIIVEGSEFMLEYYEILAEARVESMKWDRQQIPKYKDRLKKGIASEEEAILVRTQLLQTASQLVMFEVEDNVTKVKQLIDDAKSDIEAKVAEAEQTAKGMAVYLSDSEVDGLLANFTLDNFWDNGVEEATKNEMKKFETGVDQLAVTVVQASSMIAMRDQEAAIDIDQLLSDTKSTWRAEMWEA